MKASAPTMSDPPPPYAPTAGPQPGMYPNIPMPQPFQQQPYPGPMAAGVPQVVQVTVTQGFGPHSMTAFCPNCNQQVR